MTLFPLYIDLKGNNCTIFGGGNVATKYAKILLKFEAKVTIVSPSLSDELAELDKKGFIRYIPRKYFRGDCSSSYICIAATNDQAVNISISDECKARSISVNVVSPKAYGTFHFPNVVFSDDGETVVSAYSSNKDKQKKLDEKLQETVDLIEKE